MANVPATQTSSPITSLPISPEALIPPWVDLSDLDTMNFSMPPVPPGQGNALRAASKAYRNAQAPAAFDQRQAILGELRLKTVTRNEGQQEALARFRLLVEDLSDVPAEVLRDACKAYANAPGTRYFPTAGELRVYTQPAMNKLVSRSFWLNKMAMESDKAFRDEDRCPPDVARQILREEGANSPLVRSILAAIEGDNPA